MKPAKSTRWLCKVCGYIYDPALHGGVPFEQLPADWRCPGCGFGKYVFRPMPDGPVKKRDR